MVTFVQPPQDQWGQGIGGSEGSPYLNAGTGENDVPATVGVTHNWTNPANITSESASNATLTTSGGGTYVTPYLRASNFGFSIPTGAAIVGVEAQVSWGSGITFVFAEARLAWGASAGTLSLGNKADGAAVPNNTIEIYGGESDLWGEAAGTLTPAIVNSSDFGLVIKANRNDTSASPRSTSIDYMRLRVFYDITTFDGATRTTQTEALVLAKMPSVPRVTQVYAEVLVPQAAGPVVNIPVGRKQATIGIST